MNWGRGTLKSGECWYGEIVKTEEPRERVQKSQHYPLQYISGDTEILNRIPVTRTQSKFPWSRLQKQNSIYWKDLMEQIQQVFHLQN